jgi:putative spermidine/putrescine transport system permease protein
MSDHVNASTVDVPGQRVAAASCRSSPMPPAAPRRARWWRMRRVPRPVRIALLLTPALTVVGVFFAAGVAQALAQSFGDEPFLPGWHWSTAGWRALISDPAVHASLWLTLRVAGLSTVLAAILGTALAVALHRLTRRRRAAVGLVQVNLAVPHVVGALCMLLLLGQAGLLSRLAHAIGLTGAPSGFPALTADRFGVGIIAEYVWKETPFIAILALTALGRGADELAAAARTLGAGSWQRFVHVTVPLLAPTVAAGSVLVFAFAAGSYEVPYLLGRPYPATLPVVAYQQYSSTDLSARPEAMAIAVVIAAATMAIVGGYLALASRLSRRAL